jgi:protein TonB
VAKENLEISQEEAKPVVKSEPKPTLPARRLALAPLGADEEVKIPSWLAPLSQNAESAAVEADYSSEASSDDQSASLSSEEAPAFDTPHRTQGVVLGGPLLGDATLVDAPSTGSKKGLFLGLAAAVALVAGGGWYYYQNFYSPTKVVAAHSASIPAPAPEITSNVSPAPAVSTPPVKNETRPSDPPAQSARNSASNPAPAAAAPVPAPKVPSSAPKNSQLIETSPKPSLGDVHLAAPVVNHGAATQQDGDSLASIDAKTIPGSADLLAAAAAPHNAPAAPLPIGGAVSVAQLIKSVPPEYPAIARSQRVSGKVQIDALIDAEGNVAAVNVLSGPTLLHRAATDAVKRWKYKPATLNGEPTSMHLTVTVEFKAQ